jgi:hypothetical protein
LCAGLAIILFAAQNYAYQSKRRKVILLCRVLVGESLILPSDQKLTRPPEHPQGGRFDSVSGNTNGSDVFIGLQLILALCEDF